MEKRVDPFIKLSLADLAKTLARNPNLTFDFSFHSTYRPVSQTVTVSHYWSRLLDVRKKEGMKSDVYLRAFGNAYFTDFNAVRHFFQHTESLQYPLFSKQLFSLAEDQRLERVILKKRPGMKRAFSARRELLQKRYRDRYSYHKEREEWLDLLFCACYLQMIERPALLPEPLTSLKPFLREWVENLNDIETSKACAELTTSFLSHIPENLKDMHEQYCLMDPIELQINEADPFPGEKNKLVSDRDLDLDQEPESGTSQESLPTWHADQDQEGDSFLQFDLDEGASSDLMGEGERQAESGDQAFASLEGESRSREGNQFDDLPSADSKHPPSVVPGGSGYSTNDINRTAEAFFSEINRPTSEQQEAYKKMESQTLTAQKALKRSIQKLIEQKHQAPRNDLHVGRLGKKLLRLVTDERNPRLFYKKQAESRDLDVTFTLLVDCSASMHDKMDETHVGITLFHESLKSLGIPHAITGFWEDALSADDEHQPNYFSEVVSFESSLLPRQGPKILQLEPEEDNRDGFAIREAIKKLIRRPESHKILIVFTDGEPSAFNYQEQGIVDTHEAVLEARKRGIDVIGVLLSDSYTQESEKETLKNIYGRSSLVVPTAEEIPAVLNPLLRKLLSKVIA